MHTTASAGRRATLRFAGREARVYGFTGPGQGYVDVFVDRRLAATVDTYSSVGKAQQVVFDTGVLAPGRHTLELRVKGTRDRLSTGAAVALDRIDVVA
jgi:hypothetical protein